MRWRDREDARLLELALRLGVSTDMRQALESADELLARPLSADYAALGVTAPGQPTEIEWHVARLPEAYFQAYPKMMKYDFVRPAALRCPNVVLADQDMVSHSELRRSRLYSFACELGVRLEHVMAVVLAPRAPWYGGISLYRDGRTPFSNRDKRELQRAVPLLTGAIHRYRMFQQAEARGDVLEAMARLRGVEVLLVDDRGRELWRSAGLEALLDQHFASTDAWERGLPARLASLLSRLLREEPPRLLEKESLGCLTVTFVQLAPSRFWAAVFEEILPPRWRAVLSKRETEVVTRVLQGWDNKLISEDLGCTEGTVKKHLQVVFLKLAVPSRAKLIALARDSLGSLTPLCGRSSREGRKV